MLATLLGTGFTRELILEALHEPIAISVAVIVAALLFGWPRPGLDRVFERTRRQVSRPVLTAVSVFLIASISSLITAIVGALVLVEVIGLLRLADGQRVRVTVAGCFAIGMGAALTPLGEPLSTLAARALDLEFMGLFHLLAPWVFPGVLASSIVAGVFARGEYDEAPAGAHVRQTYGAIFFQAAKVFAFIAGLVMISSAYGPIANEYVSRMSNDLLFWANTVSAALDNATLVALEVHEHDAAARARGDSVAAGLGRDADTRQHPEHRERGRAQNRQRSMGEDRRADGSGHARHLFCCNQIAGLIRGEIVAQCTGSLIEARLFGPCVLL